MCRQSLGVRASPVDPVSQSSEASLLKDLISVDNQAKFIKQNLNELKILYQARGINSKYFRAPVSLREGEVPSTVHSQTQMTTMTVGAKHQHHVQQLLQPSGQMGFSSSFQYPGSSGNQANMMVQPMAAAGSN